MNLSIPRRACPRCGSYRTVYNGTTPTGKQKYHCRACGRYGTFAPDRTRKTPDNDNGSANTSDDKSIDHY